jgi:hypothetical protein
VGVRLRSWSRVRSQELEPCSASRSAQGGHQQAVVQSRSIRLAEGLLVNRVGQVYSKSEQEAALLMSLPYSVSAVACPVLGYLVDCTGKAETEGFTAALQARPHESR